MEPGTCQTKCVPWDEPTSSSGHQCHLHKIGSGDRLPWEPDERLLPAPREEQRPGPAQGRPEVTPPPFLRQPQGHLQKGHSGLPPCWSQARGRLLQVALLRAKRRSALAQVLGRPGAARQGLRGCSDTRFTGADGCQPPQPTPRVARRQGVLFQTRFCTLKVPSVKAGKLSPSCRTATG